MLKEYLKSYTDSANIGLDGIVDWKNEDKNRLCYSCCECEDTDRELYESYVCAIIVRYWPLIGINYRLGKGAYSMEDCYGWLIDSILGTLKAKSWKNQESSLFNDPLAPDKSINVRMKSHRQGFYQWSNCKKRSGDFTLNSSYEQLYETCGDSAFPLVDGMSSNVSSGSMDINRYIESEFKDKNYVSSFLLHSIINYEVFDLVKDDDGKRHMEFNKKRLYSTLRNMDNKFGKEFSTMHNIDCEDVTAAIDSCSSLSRIRLQTLINKSIEKLSKKFQYLTN